MVLRIEGHIICELMYLTYYVMLGINMVTLHVNVSYLDAYKEYVSLNAL